MSGPMPAGSPSVSASGSAMALPDLDQRLAAQFLEILLRDRLVAFLVDRIARFALGGAFAALGFNLAADGEQLDALKGDIRRRELADRRIVEDLALLLGKLSGRALDDVAHRNVRQQHREPH